MCRIVANQFQLNPRSGICPDVNESLVHFFLMWLLLLRKRFKFVIVILTHGISMEREKSIRRAHPRRLATEKCGLFGQPLAKCAGYDVFDVDRKRIFVCDALQSRFR